MKKSFEVIKMEELGGKGGVLVSSLNSEQNIRVLANAVLEQQKYGQLSPHTLKLLEEITKQ